jgi:hypothetical protein
LYCHSRRSAQAKYNDKDAGKTLFCFPSDEFAQVSYILYTWSDTPKYVLTPLNLSIVYEQNTITFCKSDYIRLTDGEFLNDNVIDLQMKRSVLRRGSMVQGPSSRSTTPAPSIASSAPASASVSSSSSSSEPDQRQLEGPSLQQEPQQQEPQQQEKLPAPVEEVKLNAAASPHNTSPVYAFSCMFYTKLTENKERVTRKVSVSCSIEWI